MKLENLRDNGSFARNTWFQIKWLILKKKNDFLLDFVLCPTFIYSSELVLDTYEIRYVVVYAGMGVLNAEIGGQSRKNFEQQIIFENTNGSQLVWYYKNGLKLDAYDQESYAE